MRFTVRLLGTEVLHIGTDKDADCPIDAGEATSYPVGFTAPSRWPIREPERDLET